MIFISHIREMERIKFLVLTQLCYSPCLVFDWSSKETSHLKHLIQMLLVEQPPQTSVLGTDLYFQHCCSVYDISLVPSCSEIIGYFNIKKDINNLNCLWNFIFYFKIPLVCIFLSNLKLLKSSALKYWTNILV